MDKKPNVLSLDLLRELELQREVLVEDGQDTSDLEAEQELNFEVYVEREYQPDVFDELNETESDDKTGGGQFNDSSIE